MKFECERKGNFVKVSNSNCCHMELQSFGDGIMLLMRTTENMSVVSCQPYVVCTGYDASAGTWSQGYYFQELSNAANFAEMLKNGSNVGVIPYTELFMDAALLLEALIADNPDEALSFIEEHIVLRNFNKLAEVNISLGEALSEEEEKELYEEILCRFRRERLL